MANTKSDLKDIIEDDLQRTDITSQVMRAIDYAINFYTDERFGFNTFHNVTVTVTSSVAQLALNDPAFPYVIINVDRVRLQMSGSYYIDLQKRDYDWVMSRQDAYHLAMPIEYGIYNYALQFDTYTNQAYTLVLDGLKSLAPVSSNSYSLSDNCSWFFPTLGRELIRAKAKENLYLHVLKDPQEAAKFAEIARMELKNLKGKDARLRSTGFVRPTQF